jgi:hypothetical protein
MGKICTLAIVSLALWATTGSGFDGHKIAEADYDPSGLFKLRVLFNS